MFGINEYYDSLLLEAKSPEEIKKILTYKYVQGKNVPEIVFEKIFNADPTKKKSYANWMLMHWGDEQQWIQKLILEDRLNSFFHYFQSRLNSAWPGTGSTASCRSSSSGTATSSDGSIFR